MKYLILTIFLIGCASKPKAESISADKVYVDNPQAQTIAGAAQYNNFLDARFDLNQLKKKANDLEQNIVCKIITGELDRTFTQAKDFLDDYQKENNPLSYDYCVEFSLRQKK